jgi:hypothetical protein
MAAQSVCSASSWYHNGGLSVLGNITVSSTNTSPTYMINPYETDRERLSVQRQKLKTLYHAAKCCQDERELSSCCTVRHCLASKTLYIHVANCTQACQVPGCKNGKLIWKHYRDCRIGNCRICSAVPTTYKESGIHKKYVSNAKSSSATTTRSIATRSDTVTATATTLVSQDIIKTVTTSVKSQSRSSYGPTMPVLMDKFENEDESIMTSSPTSIEDKTTFLKPRLGKELLQVQQQQAPQHQPGPGRPPLLKGSSTQRSQRRRVLQERKNVSTANTSNTTTMTKGALAPPKQQQQQGGRPSMPPRMTVMIPRHTSPPPSKKKPTLSPPRGLAARYNRPPLSPIRALRALV